MKKLSAFLVVSALAVWAFADEATTKSATPTAKSAVVATLQASEAKITAPLVLKDSAIGQPEQTELPQSGKAIFTFKVEKAGTYIITAVVNAAGEDANSFYLNIDAAPEDPLMIWDIDVTTGFEERTVSWRGNGDANADEFAPKKFTLTAGEHKLHLYGREPAQLKSLSFRLTQ